MGVSEDVLQHRDHTTTPNLHLLVRFMSLNQSEIDFFKFVWDLVWLNVIKGKKKQKASFMADKCSR